LAINDLDQFIEIKSLQGVKISKAEAIARLLSPHWHYYGAFLNNELVSMAGTYLKLPEIWVVGDVFTLPQHRNKGLAKAVTSAVTNDSVLSGAMTMLHVFEDNSPAIKAYKGLGYRAIQTLLWINYKP
jgi:predicted GNAT family acetyltransferase